MPPKKKKPDFGWGGGSTGGGKGGDQGWADPNVPSGSDSNPGGGKPWLDTPVSDAPGTPTNPGTPTTPAEPESPWTQANQSAYDLMLIQLQQWGLGTFGNVLRSLIEGGITDSAGLELALQDTQEWKLRFAGNEQLKAQGLGVLSPAEYLALERSYAQIMRNYGLPPGFYDDPSDYAGFIGKNLSPSELQTRVQAYADLANREDPATVAQLNSMGLSRGDLLAYMIDPDRATPLIEQTYKTALLGGAARRAGVVADNSYLGELAAQGITEQQAAQGYGLIAGSLATAENLADIYDEDYDMRDMESEVFQNNGAAANKRKRLASQERAAFSGSAGVGNLTRNNAGSY